MRMWAAIILLAMAFTAVKWIEGVGARNAEAHRIAKSAKVQAASLDDVTERNADLAERHKARGEELRILTDQLKANAPVADGSCPANCEIIWPPKFRD